MAQSAAHKHDSTRRATYQDVLDAPAHQVAEIIEGTLHTHPRPAPRHTLASSTLGNELGPPFHRGRGGPGGWWILDEPELHLGEDILVPDNASATAGPRACLSRARADARSASTPAPRSSSASPSATPGRALRLRCEATGRD